MPISSVRRQVWHGAVPLRVLVAEPESIGRQEVLVMAGRVSYLRQHLDPVLAYVAKYVTSSASTDEANNNAHWWFEFSGQPLPHTLPIGLLHDLYVGEPSSEPWVLHLKRGAFPASRLVELPELADLRVYWLNQLKESAFVRQGHSRAVMDLSVAKLDEAWQAVEMVANQANHNPEGAESPPTRQDSGDQFWGAADSVFRRAGTDGRIPVRFHVLDNNNEPKVKQVNAEPSATLGECLEKAGWGNEGARLHGLEIATSQKLGQIYPLCTYPDGFLHLVVL